VGMALTGFVHVGLTKFQATQTRISSKCARRGVRMAAAGQKWDAEAYGTHAAFVPNLMGADLMQEALRPQKHERILDLGCGDGALTGALAARCRQVVGIDASEELLRKARESHPYVSFYQMDGQDEDAIAGLGPFDAVFSNAALHWMKRDPAAVVRGAYRTLGPSGRFVAECGGAGNVEEIRLALRAALTERGITQRKLEEEVDPWVFHSPEEYTELLTSVGFAVDQCVLYPKPIDVGLEGLRGWIRTFGNRFLDFLPDPQEREAVITEVMGVAKRNLQDPNSIPYVRLRFIAMKK